MELFEIDAGLFKLDGGAMYGVVPKTFWNKWNVADENNLCTWKMRCLLIQDGKKLILIDTGMGNKQPEKWQSYFQPHGDSNLIDSIRKVGFNENDITDVILTHLHFDHCGGAVSNVDGKLKTTFKNAKYWTHSCHWKWAIKPNIREKATYLSENIMPIEQNGQLFFIDNKIKPFKNIELLLADGHTEKMIMPLIHIDGKKILFTADTIPSASHIHIPYVMGYDVRPLQTMNEKENILIEATKNDWLLYYDHDPVFSCSKVELTEKGYRAINNGNLKDFGF
jgi:glyoxylase-like metal-dependent hydrolase (beta-lactamase superfamily II)